VCLDIVIFISPFEPAAAFTLFFALPLRFDFSRALRDRAALKDIDADARAAAMIEMNLLRAPSPPRHFALHAAHSRLRFAPLRRDAL